jgi:hypothetical protein
MTIWIEATSLSAWMNTPPSRLESLSDIYSGISFWGVIGYPK